MISWLLPLLYISYVSCYHHYALVEVPTPEVIGRLNLKKAINHFVGDLNNDTREFTYVLFTDPQLGLYDVVKKGDGRQWQYDLDNMKKFSVAISKLSPTPDFILCLGDLNNAYPEASPGKWPQSIGFLPPYRPAQTLDLMQNLQENFRNDIPMFMLAGNHDLTENTEFKHLDAFEKVWGNGYFYFWNGGRVFISLETQLFRSEQKATVELLRKEIDWLVKLFQKLPHDAPKTVFQHVALFIEKALEVDSARVGKAIPVKHRKFLLRLFCNNNVQTVYSGHTHFNSFPKPYRCPNRKDRQVRQIVLTSLTAQLKWKSDTTFYPVGTPSYLIANVDKSGKTSAEVVKLETDK